MPTDPLHHAIWSQGLTLHANEMRAVYAALRERGWQPPAPRPAPAPGGDRFAAQAWPHGDQPCPSCGTRPDSVPAYRPTQPAPISPTGRAAYQAFADKPEGRPR